MAEQFVRLTSPICLKLRQYSYPLKPEFSRLILYCHGMERMRIIVTNIDIFFY